MRVDLLSELVRLKLLDFLSYYGSKRFLCLFFCSETVLAIAIKLHVGFVLLVRAAVLLTHFLDEAKEYDCSVNFITN